ncbi:hypothetical protein PLICRDRAFT_35206 [Plicaturopsis crispa FD-325 SS-3]|nr:hypothetical protein PLICRDRAFT_35206 [Plicaturopsis crispa FD-325 SS-3]
MTLSLPTLPSSADCIYTLALPTSVYPAPSSRDPTCKRVARPFPCAPLGAIYMRGQCLGIRTRVRSPRAAPPLQPMARRLGAGCPADIRRASSLVSHPRRARAWDELSRAGLTTRPPPPSPPKTTS